MPARRLDMACIGSASAPRARARRGADGRASPTPPWHVGSFGSRGPPTRPHRISDDDIERVASLSTRRAAEELGIPSSVLHRARVSRNPSRNASLMF